jgi:ferredoxin-type protein NapH
MPKSRQPPARQRVRKAIQYGSFLLFPITLYYFSPALILQASSEGVINASALVFVLQFLSALFLGRLWCGWACPAGELQDLASPINNRRIGSRTSYVKWFIWVPWILLIIVMVMGAGGYRRVDPFYQLEGGVTMAIPSDPESPPWYMIYYTVVGLLAILAVAFGRRAGCHTICWMAPFMILGRKLSNLARWPALRLLSNADRCVNCMTCTRGCPMSIDVHGLVHSHSMEHSECILCGTCVDSCPKDVIRYVFSAGD